MKHSDFVHLHNHIGNVLVSLGRFDEAEAHYLRSLEIRKKVYGPRNNFV